MAMQPKRFLPADRKGNYSLMFGVALVGVLGAAAFAIDVAYMRYAQAQAQDVADAASTAALIALRKTGDVDLATSAAQAVVNANLVVGESPRMVELSFGGWDDSMGNPFFETGVAVPNAVRVTVDRIDESGPHYQFANLFGMEQFDVRASATSATRSFQIAFVTDITNSWSEKNFGYARQGAVLGLDMLHASASGIDEVGMTIFTNRFAWEYTPFTMISDDAAYSAIRVNWNKLATASKAGKDTNYKDGSNCTLNTGTKLNNFSSPVVGGCYPWMPREYSDEPGTDHSTGLGLAKQMFQESNSAAVYRAQIVLTDGQPNGLGNPGTIRASQGYVETRWREFLGPAPRTTAQIRTASTTVAQQMWDQLGVHTWVISFVADDSLMTAMVHGDGYYIRTTNAAKLSEIYSQIISELPIALVE